MSIQRKEIRAKCYRCKNKNKNCPACKGTGIFKTFISIYIDDKKKIAFDGDDGK